MRVACCPRPAYLYSLKSFIAPSVLTVAVTVFVFVMVTSSLLRHHRTLENTRTRKMEVGYRGPVPYYKLPARKETGVQHPEREDGELLLTIPPQGRLGNQMFQYAALLGIAHMNNRSSFVASSSDVTRYFLGVSVEDRLTSRWRRLKEKHYASKNTAFDSLPRENLKLIGFFQSWKYFSEIPDEVRKAFVFKPQIFKLVRSLFQKYTEPLAQNVTKIGVHVRRTDMLSAGMQNLGYRPAPVSYLKNAFRYMRSRFGNQTNFFLISDDPDWCSSELSDEKEVWIVDMAPTILHLGFLTLCDHVIMTVGTFGWWAAYLSAGHVVYYDGFPAPDSDVSKGFSREDYYLPEWVPMGG